MTFWLEKIKKAQKALRSLVSLLWAAVKHFTGKVLCYITKITT